MVGLCGPYRAVAQEAPAPSSVSEPRPPDAPPPPSPTAEAAAVTSRPAARPRVAIFDFLLEGEGQSPGLAMQLRDGFLIGLVREGIDVIDSTDVAKKLQNAPELHGCETSPCLKRLGELLAVRFLLRLKVSLGGNSYRMSARVFSTEGAAPAALPIATFLRPCDVCTVNEARDHMIRLAEAVRARLVDNTAPAPPPLPPAPAPRSRTPAFITLAAGAAAILGGALLIASSPTVGKGRPALGGGLMGLGLAASLVGTQAAFDRSAPGTWLRRAPPEP